MSPAVCSPLPGLDTRAHHLHNQVPLTYPEYAPTDASTSARNTPSSRQRRRTDWCRRGLRLDMCDWEYHAD
jgi:hypothetical protein